jgi:hypothetical protein
MSWFDPTTWFSNAESTANSWNSSDGWDYDFSNNQSAYDSFLNDYNSNSGSGFTSDWSGFAGQATPDASPSTWEKILTNPGVLGAAITSGAGLIGGMSRLNAEKEAVKAQQEQQKMNQMLELAKLKYQLLSKGGGRASGAGGGSQNRAQDIQNQFSANQASGYQSLGNNLAATYR